LVKVPLIVTTTVCPVLATFGLAEAMPAGGLTVRAAGLLLTKAAPVVVVPAIETLYAVGTVTVSEAGTWKVTRRVVPRIVCTAVAVAWPVGGPEVAGCKATVTLAGEIVPEGKPDPVTLMIVTPACPALGEAGDVSFTCVWAAH
jgi:hypothetical protein